jgi:hypothetical protein
MVYKTKSREERVIGSEESKVLSSFAEQADSVLAPSCKFSLPPFLALHECI